MPFSISSNGEPIMVIGILDHMGYGNLGDAATQDVAIANIKKRLPGAQLVGFSFIPHDTTERHGIPCYPIRWWYPVPDTSGDAGAEKTAGRSTLKTVLKRAPFIYVWAKPLHDLMHEALFWVSSYRAVRKLDLLIISGGGQLSDLWRGPWSHPYTIFKFCLLTKVARKKLYFLNVGAGPLGHPLSKLFAKCALQLADYRSFRDADSQQLVRSLGVSDRTHVYPDLAYGLDVDTFSSKNRCASSTPVVGINPIGFCDPRIWPRKDGAIYEEYLGKIVEFSLWLLKHGYSPRMFTTELSVDKYALDDLKARLRSRVAPETLCEIFQAASENVKDVLQQMAHFDFVVTSKYHGIIFSHVLGKPVISLSYHRKMDFAMRAVGQDRFCTDIEHFDTSWLIDSFRSLADEDGTARPTAVAVVEKYAAALSQQFDELFRPDNAPTAAAPRSSLAISSS